MLREVGEHLGALLRSDVAARCRLGVGSKHLGRAERKRALTPRCSSRWAGAITRTTDDMVDSNGRCNVSRVRSYDGSKEGSSG